MSVAHPRTFRWRVLSAGAAVVVASLTVTSCTTLPTNTEPQAIRSFEAQSADNAAQGPTPGREADLLVRDFYAASAIPVGDYETARAFLTPAAQEAWNPEDSTLVVDRIDLNTQPGATGQRRSLAVRAEVIGSLHDGGAFVPENGVYEATLELEQVDGEWRISSLPAGIILERTELRNQYQPFNLYFLNSTGQNLVPDRRWVFTQRESVDTVLMSLLAAGPAQRLRPAVMTGVGENATFSGKTDGVYEFTGIGDMGREDRLRFASQIVWTLAVAGVPGPYRITFDGAPVSEETDGLTTDDFAGMNPQSVTSDVGQFYALHDGRLFSVTGSQAQPVDGPLGSEGNIASVDVSIDGSVASVLKGRNDDSDQIFAVGGLANPRTEVLRAREISRPSFELARNVAWVVVDGERVIRAVRSTASGEVVSNEVAAPFLEDIDGEISVLRISSSGASVAMIIDGRLFTGIVERSAAGERQIVNVLEYAHDLDGTAISADWMADGALIVGTSSPETPVVRVEQDGSAVTTMPTGNINAPVVMVAASPVMLYATDAQALLQLPTNNQDAIHWREVPGLQGARSAPVVAR